MSIKKYTNFDKLNSRIESEADYIQPEDLFVITKQGETEETEFGQCTYDVMEVAVYDINNNLLPQKSGNNVSYIKNADISNYLYETRNPLGKKELAINVEKLLVDLGFSNGILKINVNFVRNKMGSNNPYRRVWIQEISATRQEIRVLPLKTIDSNTNTLNENELQNLQEQRIEFYRYRKFVLDGLDAAAATIKQKIKNAVMHQFGEDIFYVLRKDFGISNFDNYSQHIFDDFKQSVTYYMDNRHYIIGDGNYGKSDDNIRFKYCDVYSFDNIETAIEGMLVAAVEHNTNIFVKKRELLISSLPKSFEIIELQKQIQDTLNTITPIQETVQKIFNPQNVDFELDDRPARNIETTEQAAIERFGPRIFDKRLFQDSTSTLIEKIRNTFRTGVTNTTTIIQPEIIEPVILTRAYIEPGEIETLNSLATNNEAIIVKNDLQSKAETIQ